MVETPKQQRQRKIVYAQKLRKRMTCAEEILWEQLRDRRCAGLKFRRQAPISWFIADFLCMERSLIIEVDGSVHRDQAAYDHERDSELMSLEYKILRLTNDDVIHHLDTCIMKIIEASS